MAGLTGRQRAVLRELEEGRRAHSIAESLAFPVGEVKRDIAAALGAFGVDTQLELYALLHRL
jgi:DNA-binding NarL/FixJ family response regulator